MGLSDNAISLNVPKGPCSEKIPGAGETQELALDSKARDAGFRIADERQVVSIDGSVNVIEDSRHNEPKEGRRYCS
jgi:hypothetical protein